MEPKEIISLSKKNIETENLEKAKKILEKNYIVSYGEYEPFELKKAIDDKTPLFIKDNFIIGYDPTDGSFVNSDKEKIRIRKMVKAIIVEDIKDESDTDEPEKHFGDVFAIIGKDMWGDISDFHKILGSLRVGQIYLPPHSAIFNFLEPAEEQKKKKIVSMLSGVNINIYDKDNYIDNCIHEIGHLFWRDCLTFDEKQKFKEYFKFLKPSAIYEYEWETDTEEEAFCTIYKWYVKSLLIHQSFYNILEFEEPEGLKLLQSVFERIAKERMIDDIWESSKADVMDYLNPKFDKTTGRYIRRAGLLDKIKDVELPRSVLQDIDRIEDGIEYISLGKATVPVKGNKVISWENRVLKSITKMTEFEKAKMTKYISKKPDGKGGWIYTYDDSKKKVKN